MKTNRKFITVVTGCFNEEENIQIIYEQVRAVFTKLPQYTYEHIFIDNASKDRTVTILKEIAAKDPNVKIIVNTRNFGHVRSPYYGMLQGFGDAVIYIVADLQDPPSLIREFLAKWEEGYPMVLGIKKGSEESAAFYAVRKFYYNLVSHLSDVDLIKNFTGYGLFDRSVMEVLRSIEEPYPYFRGLICDLGFERATIEYVQPSRKRGITKNNFYTLYDLAILGIINHSKIPLRLATMTGFLLGTMSLLVAFGYFVYKIVFWDSFSLGIAPLVIGLFFFSSVQLFFIGLIGEYIGAIHTQVLKRPLVIEKERINFD